LSSARRVGSKGDDDFVIQTISQCVFGDLEIILTEKGVRHREGNVAIEDMIEIVLVIEMAFLAVLCKAMYNLGKR
jgi:hypothetical protein